MNFDKTTIDAIKSAVDLREEVNPYIEKAKAQRDGSVHSLCPFPDHADSEPSFVAHKEFFVCFGCHKRGDVYSWYELYHKMPFVDAVRELGRKAGIAVGFEDEASIKAWREEKNVLYAKVQRLYEYLQNSVDALEYLTNRGITTDSIDRYMLGYSKEHNAIAIPLFDSAMRVYTIHYRSLDDSEKRRYFFDESTRGKVNGKDILWNEPCASRITGKLYICEGEFDAMILEQHGLNAVAFHGSNISEGQLRRIRLMRPTTLVYAIDNKTDNDVQLSRKNAFFLKNNLDIPIKIISPKGDINATPENELVHVLAQEMTVELAFIDSILQGDMEAQRIAAKKYIQQITDVLARDDVIAKIAAAWEKPKELVANYLNIQDTTRVILDVPDVFDRIEELASHTTIGQALIDDELAPYFGNLGKQHVACITARTGVGKTNFGLNLCTRFSEDVDVLYISLEQPATELMTRLLSMKMDTFGGIDGSIIRPQDVKRIILEHPDQWLYLRTLIAEVMPHMHFYDKTCSIETIRDVIAVAKDRYGPELVAFVDYAGLIQNKISDPYTKATDNALGLQNAAKDLDVLIIYMHQLSRRGGDGTEEVSIDMLRDSGAIEETLDLLLGIWYRDKDSMSQIAQPMNGKILKNRHGPQAKFDWVLDTRNLVFRKADDPVLTGIPVH